MSVRGIEARALEPRDLAALKALRLEGIRLFPDAFLLTEAEALAASDDAMMAGITAGNAHGVFDSDTLIGLAGLNVQWSAQTRHRAQMGPFYVTPAHQGTGAADVLIEHIFTNARARNATQVELQVAAANPRARVFYARHGFAVTGHLPAAVVQNGSPLDDLFMVCDVTQPHPAQGPDGLRRLHAGDWRIFRAIRLEMLEKAPTGFGMTIAEFAAKAPDEIMQSLRSTHLWAVVEDGCVVATAGWHIMPGAVQAHRGHVVAVYTTPAARGRGLAAQLLATVADDAKAAGMLQLELDVGAENTAARAAYEAQGYRVTGTIPGALNHGGHIHDQLFMVRSLSTL